MSKPALTWNLHLPDMSVDRKKGAGLKKRKICSVLIAGILSVGMILTGCGAGQPGGQSQKKVTEAEKKLRLLRQFFLNMILYVRSQEIRWSFRCY